MTRAAIAERVLRARLEEAGLEIRRGPFNVVTTDGPVRLTVELVVPASLIDDTEEADRGDAQTAPYERADADTVVADPADYADLVNTLRDLPGEAPPSG